MNAKQRRNEQDKKAGVYKTVLRAIREAQTATGWSISITNVADMMLDCSGEELMDMAGFVAYVNEHSEDPMSAHRSILTNLSHDIGGIFRSETCFSPRTSGYAKFLPGRCNGCGAELDSNGWCPAACKSYKAMLKSKGE